MGGSGEPKHTRRLAGTTPKLRKEAPDVVPADRKAPHRRVDAGRAQQMSREVHLSWIRITRAFCCPVFPCL